MAGLKSGCLCVAAAISMLGATSLQAQATELPRLMTARSVMSFPAAVPAKVIEYGPSARQKIEVFLPRSATGTPEVLRPVVVLIHGGCWLGSGSGPEIMRPMAGALVDKGYAVWSIGYRAVDEEGGGYPGTFQDIAQAIDLIRDHAEAEWLDAGRVVIAGHSTGGSLALWAAGRHKLPAESVLASAQPLKPIGVISLAGFGSLKNWESPINRLCGTDALARLVPGDSPERFSDTSPDQLLPIGLPSVLLHGIYDGFAFPAMGLEYAEQARRGGDRSDIRIAPVTGHYEMIAPGTSAFSQTISAISRFLDH